MFTSPIQDILAQRLQEMPAIIAAPNLKRDIDELVPAGRAAVIDDVNTAAAYGDLVAKALPGAAHFTLPTGVKADAAALAEIAGKSAHADLLVAVGSGTVNDLVKYVAHKAGKPYVLFPTAASMNGYVSANASIEIDGHKQSLAATLPRAVFVDWQLLAAAPARLSASGLGDSLARPTAQTDWLLAHYLTGEAYDDTPYRLIAPYEPEAFGQAQGIACGDGEAVSALFRLLLLSGFGMTIAGSSRPASGAEHMVAHLMNAADNLHGEEIAVMSVEMASRQAALLASASPHILPVKDGTPRAIPANAWEKAREAIASVCLPPEKLAAIRAAAGLPDSILKLGWDAQTYKDALKSARFSRERFTCLDMLPG